MNPKVNTLGRAALGGLLAALVMAILAYAGWSVGLIDRDLLEMVARLYLAAGSPATVLVLASLGTHLCIGVVWALVFAYFVPSGGIRNGILFATIPWILMMGVMFLSFQLGIIAVALTWGVAAISLALHLVYGAQLGWWMKHPRAWAIWRPAGSERR